MTISVQEMTYGVGEAAELVGLTAYTLRWYEQEGLVEPVHRDSAGRRRYTQRDLDYLVLLTKLRRTGMSVADMRRYAELVRLGPQTMTERYDLLLAHRERVVARIAELTSDLETVDYKIQMYHGR